MVPSCLVCNIEYSRTVRDSPQNNDIAIVGYVLSVGENNIIIEKKNKTKTNSKIKKKIFYFFFL